MEFVYAGSGVVGDRCLPILRSLLGPGDALSILVPACATGTTEIVPACDVLWSVHWRKKFSAKNIARARVAALNVHNSYLPWGKGADSCYWALREPRPEGFKHGATVHWLDAGIDTGDIVWQRLVEVFEWDTPETLYDRTANEEVWLFTMITRALLSGAQLGRTKQVGVGSFHRKADRVKA